MRKFSNATKHKIDIQNLVGHLYKKIVLGSQYNERKDKTPGNKHVNKCVKYMKKTLKSH